MYYRAYGWILSLKTQQVNNIAEQTWSLIKTQSVDCECYHNISISILWLLVIMTRRFACASKCTKRPQWRVNMWVFEVHPSKQVFAFSSLLRRHRELQHAVSCQCHAPPLSSTDDVIWARLHATLQDQRETLPAPQIRVFNGKKSGQGERLW